jgi:hypothetical protein
MTRSYATATIWLVEACWCAPNMISLGLRAGEFFPVEGFHLGQPVEYGGNLDQAG